MEKAYRILIIISALSYTMYYFMPYIDHLWLAEDELVFLSNNGAKAIIIFPSFISDFIFFMWLITSVGLFMYIPVARKAFVILLIIAFLQIPFMGFVAFSPLETLLVYLANTIDGALLIIIYLTSVSAKFVKIA